MPRPDFAGGIDLWPLPAERSTANGVQPGTLVVISTTWAALVCGIKKPFEIRDCFGISAITIDAHGTFILQAMPSRSRTDCNVTAHCAVCTDLVT